MNFHTECRNVLLFEFSREMSLDERGLEIMLAIAGVFACEGREGQAEFQLIAKAIAITLYRGFVMADLSCSAITDKHKLEAGNLRGSFRHFVDCFSLAFAIKFRRAV
jgi:hypothetical protein